MLINDREIIEISGLERKSFLQGLITNDVNQANNSNLIYSAMLNAQGRFLYDFFIFEQEDKLLIDCLKSRAEEIVKKLNLYKLRAKVEIKKNEELAVYWSNKKIENITQNQFQDPRNKNLGYRIYQKKQDEISSSDEYNFVRIFNKVPESEQDLTYEKSFILEFGFDDLNAINYEKGCYVGQELTARTHYRGEIRKKIFYFKLDQNIDRKILTKNNEIACEGKTIGLILSHVFFNSSFHALALINISEADKFSDFENKLEILGNKILPLK